MTSTSTLTNRYAGLPAADRRRLTVADAMRRQPLAVDLINRYSARRLAALPSETRLALAEDICWHHQVTLGGDTGRAFDKLMGLTSVCPALLGNHDVAFGHAANEFMRHPAGVESSKTWATMNQTDKLRSLNALARRLAHVLGTEAVSLMAKPLEAGLDGETPDCTRYCNEKGHVMLVLNNQTNGPLSCQTAAATTVFRAQIEQALRQRMAAFGADVPADVPHATDWKILRLAARHVTPAMDTAAGRAHLPIGRLLDTLTASFDARLRLPGIIGPVVDFKQRIR